MLPILYEDSSLLLINKPAGITVNRSDTTAGQETVQDFTDVYLQKELTPTVLPESTDSDEELSTDFYLRSGIVHRLDKETSGILIVAKSQDVFSALQGEFKERRVEKSYLALAHGKVTPMIGEINVPVGRLPWNRRQFGVVAGGRESLTKYSVVSYFRTADSRKEIVSLVELHPLTGRTHQIRVHLQYLGYPIFSDFLYAGRKTQREDRKLLERVFLHAAAIAFIHPTSKKRVSFAAPLPTELQSVMDQLVPMI